MNTKAFFVGTDIYEQALHAHAVQKPIHLRKLLSFRRRFLLASPQLQCTHGMQVGDMVMRGLWIEDTGVKTATSFPTHMNTNPNYLQHALLLPPGHLLLDSAPNLGPLISRWEINKFENYWYKCQNFTGSKAVVSEISEFVNFPTRYEWFNIRGTVQ